ncbi:unnamed protein product [Protopolystoma xenopodis]|uniref:Uncharacterized protein n=1 Tax=Protopolystoma xenopodis TaxID=117903 RepID=A0A3S5AN25_9PLAT|nr:unnamed protein product [Protopolystoma xenopodis]
MDSGWLASPGVHFEALWTDQIKLSEGPGLRWFVSVLRLMPARTKMICCLTFFAVDAPKITSGPSLAVVLKSKVQLGLVRRSLNGYSSDVLPHRLGTLPKPSGLAKIIVLGCFTRST